MNRHNSYQQPEVTANDANAKQWQSDVPEQGASKVDNYGNASEVNSGKNANDTNRTSDQGETVEVRVIKGDRDEPNDRSSRVEQGSQASQTVWASAEAQPTGIEVVKQISPESVLDIAVDAIESSARERQVESS